tara:strand:- start:6932 stop:8827 length:1896 start_codon:yes stop_codon:yes gene_type:complete
MGLNKVCQRCLIAVLIPAFAAPAVAQDTPETEETIVVIGARVPIPQSEVTAAVTTLNADEVDLHGGTFAADALRSVPGLTVSRSGPAGSLTDVRARGSEANHVLVLIDGIEAGNPFTGGYDFAQASGFGVDRIEVLRGEQSALWGPDAIGGVINIQTIGHDGEDRLDLLAEAGSFSTRRVGVAAAGSHGAISGGGALSVHATDGIDASGTGGAPDGYDLATVSANGTLELSPIARLTSSLRATRYESEFDSDTDFDGRLDDVDRVREGDQVAARLSLVLEPQAFGLDWRNEVAVSVLDDRAETRNSGTFGDRSEGRRWQGFVQSTLQWSALDVDHRLTGLIERETERYVSDGGPGSGQNQTRDVTTDALAMDYGATSGPLSLHVSARLDDNEMFEDATTWRVGASYAVPALGGRVRGGFGEGVKNPGVFELFGFFPAFFVGNPDLRPESSRGWDIGWEQDFSNGHLALTWFEAELEDEIYSDFGVFPATARNRLSRSNRSGLEIEGDWSPRDDLTVRASAAFLRSDENGTPEIRRPERAASLSATWDPVGRPVSLSLAADYVSDARDTDFGTFQTVTLDAYTLVSGRAAWRFENGAQLYLRGENLMDETYEDVFGYASPGRGLYLGLRFQR